jgi:hypothetical protein
MDTPYLLDFYTFRELAWKWEKALRYDKRVGHVIAVLDTCMVAATFNSFANPEVARLFQDQVIIR